MCNLLNDNYITYNKKVYKFKKYKLNAKDVYKMFS